MRENMQVDGIYEETVEICLYEEVNETYASTGYTKFEADKSDTSDVNRQRKL